MSPLQVRNISPFLPSSLNPKTQNGKLCSRRMDICAAGPNHRDSYEGQRAAFSLTLPAPRPPGSKAAPTLGVKRKKEAPLGSSSQSPSTEEGGEGVVEEEGNGWGGGDPKRRKMAENFRDTYLEVKQVPARGPLGLIAPDRTLSPFK